MKEKRGCPNHPENEFPEEFRYHATRGWVCYKCGSRPTLLEFTTVVD